MKTSIVLSWLMCACGELLAQQVWKVHCLGAHGAHFTDLPQAVAAASPGDEIQVYWTQGVLCQSPGTYTAPVITKPLRIAGFSTAFGSGVMQPCGVTLSGLVVILGIPAGHKVELSGLETSPATLGGFVAVGCDGEILLENCVVLNNGLPLTYAHFERCRHVVWRGAYLQLGGYPLTAVDSNVLLTTVSISHHAPSPIGPPWGFAATAPAVRVVNSKVTAIGCVLDGAASAVSIPGGSYLARPAVRVESGVFRAGPATLLRGGFISGSPFPFAPYEVLDPQTGEVRLDPRGQLAGPVIPTPPPVPETIDATYHSWVVANELFGVTVAGPVNGFALLCLGDWHPNTPSPLGPLALDPASAFPVALVQLPGPSGFHQWTLHCPLAAPVAHGFALQALTLAPNGVLGVTEPSPLMVSWPANVFP